MTPERRKELDNGINPKSDLTDAERAQGWHWCNEYDGLLVGPGSDELHECMCFTRFHPVYQTKPSRPEGC